MSAPDAVIKQPAIQRELYQSLAARLGTRNLEKRLAIECQEDPQAFGQGLTFFHPENWFLSNRLIHMSLRVTMLLKRAQRNALNITVKTNEVTIPRLPPAFDGFRLLHLTDLHLDMNQAFPAILSECIAGLDYELCVLTGDYRYRTHGASLPAMLGMEEVRRHIKSPVYGVLGNHDSIEIVSALEAMDISVLLNEWVAIRRSSATIYLSGIDDPHFFQTDDLAAARAGIPEHACSILLAHSPEVYQRADKQGFDFMLCGHTHGGQIALPGGVPVTVNARCPREFCKGAWSYGALQGYTSVGAGSSIVDARLNCPPEVTLHRLRSGLAEA